MTLSIATAGLLGGSTLSIATDGFLVSVSSGGGGGSLRHWYLPEVWEHEREDEDIILRVIKRFTGRLTI